MKKNPVIITITFSSWFILVFFVIWPWIHQLDSKDYLFSYLAHLNAIIWWIVLFWAFHHLGYKFFSFFKQDLIDTSSNKDIPEIAILYLTCDDFIENACGSCIEQDYPHFRLLICDDSSLLGNQHRIEEFTKKQSLNSSKIRLIRRNKKNGYKAGNINHALRNEIKEDWFLLVDADQILPKKYLSQLVKNIPKNPTNTAFIQAASKAYDDHEEISVFQSAMGPEVSLFYNRDLSYRENCGFLPLLGHGALINTKICKSLGGFPEIVSEDFAYALRAVNQKKRGIYVENVSSNEAFPFDFGGFIIRLKKFSGGTAEIFKRELSKFLFGPATFIEKYDFFILMIWYLLMPLIVLNSYLGAYIVHGLWSQEIIYLHPALPYLYTGMFISIFVLNNSITKNWGKTLRFYFWSTAIYSAALPGAGWSFVKNLLFGKPRFNRTPKGSYYTPLNLRESVFMVMLGLIACGFSLYFLSPFSPILLGQGIAYLSYPFYSQLNRATIIGQFARIIIYIPGLMMMFALYAMWIWGRY